MISRLARTPDRHPDADLDDAVQQQGLLLGEAAAEDEDRRGRDRDTFVTDP